MDDTHQIELRMIEGVELYLATGETIEQALRRGNFSEHSRKIVSYRAYELNDDGDPENYGQWIEVEPFTPKNWLD